LEILHSDEEINALLKPFFISVWLHCIEPVNDPNDDGSELVVTWFTDNPWTKLFNRSLRLVLRISTGMRMLRIMGCKQIIGTIKLCFILMSISLIN
jgi:hypothetical protein